MGGIQFKGGKLHGADEVKAKLMHCDKNERLKHNHSNKNINKELTMDYDFQDVNYSDSYKKYKIRIKELDKDPKQNHKLDRVSAFS